MVKESRTARIDKAFNELVSKAEKYELEDMLKDYLTAEKKAEILDFNGIDYS